MHRSIPKRLYWRILRLFSKQLSWDKQFNAGVWTREPHTDQTIGAIVGLCNGGRLIEFGAGEGALPLSLPRNIYSEYIGFDISTVAVEKAREKAAEAGLTKCRFEQCDMAHWKGGRDVSVAVLEECLYYLTPRETETFLRRCSESLLPNGRILVIVHSAKKHARTLDICRRVCRVEEEATHGGRTFLVLAKN